MESVLKKYFGYSQFRPYQKEIIQKILDGQDCLVVMATGSGKSLCTEVNGKRPPGAGTHARWVTLLIHSVVMGRRTLSKRRQPIKTFAEIFKEGAIRRLPNKAISQPLRSVKPKGNGRPMSSP